MRHLACVLVAVFFVAVWATDSTDRQLLFQEWCAHWKKTYDTPAELERRFSIFSANLDHIHAKNKNSGKAVHGLTKFSDLTPVEFKQLYLKTHINKRTSPPMRSHLRTAIPSEPIDWAAMGKVTPLKNQGMCGSAFVYAVVETVESANMALGKRMTVGSVQEVIDCGNANGTFWGCNGGDPFGAFSWVISQGGLESDSCYGPEDPSQGCKESECPVNPDPNLLLSGIVSVPRTDAALYGALTKAPVFVCVDAVSWQSYQGGIISASQCGSDLDHCVQLTGYSPAQGGYWILRNTWGEDWGNDGYVWLQYGSNTCGITENAVLATI